MHPRRTRSAPHSQSKSQFLGVFAGWLRFGGIFRRRRLKKVDFFAACTPKGVQQIHIRLPRPRNLFPAELKGTSTLKEV